MAQLVVGDVCAALAAGSIAVLSNLGVGHNNLRIWWTFTLVPLWLAVCALGRCYEQALVGHGREEFRRVTHAGMALIAIVSVVSYGFHLQTSRAWVVVALPLTVLFSVAVRVGSRTALARSRGRGLAQHKVVVVGRPEAAARLVERMTEDAKGGWEVVAGCVEDGTRLEDTIAAVRSCGADTVAVAADAGLTPLELRKLGWELEGLGVDLVVSTDLIEVAGPRIHIRAVAGMPLLHVSTPEMHGPRKLVKAGIDRGVAAVALFFLTPLMLVLAAMVKLDSRGPAIFKQRRVGRHGKEFTVLKFRSMTDGAERMVIDLRDQNESDGLLFKMKDDPRITRCGKWMRRWSLDELPQLINVLVGHMSLVGPRPPLPEEVAQYGDDVRRRLLVKPGLTGLWQVSGRSDLSWEQSVRLDLSYVENWSVTLDAVILGRTLGAVLKRTGSY
jgi:exopolysaccharide biosynthesis polyprenyl glycosylphosphotransferase